MRLALVNPNTTAGMTATCVAAAEAVTAPGTVLVGLTPADGPASIEGPYDEAFALPGLIRTALAAEWDGADAVVVACFDDPGLEPLRAALRVPVVGIVEASLHAAASIADRMAVVTTTTRSLARIRELAHRYGVAERCRVYAADVPVLALETGGCVADSLEMARFGRDRAARRDIPRQSFVGQRHPVGDAHRVPVPVVGDGDEHRPEDLLAGHP